MFTSNGLMCFCGESMCRIGMASLISYFPRCLDFRARKSLNRRTPVAPPSDQNFEPIGSSGFDQGIIEASGNFFGCGAGKPGGPPRALSDTERTALAQRVRD